MHIRLKIKNSWYASKGHGAEIGTLGPVASIRLKIKNSCCASTGQGVQKLVQLAILSPMQTILHPHNVGQPRHLMFIGVGGGGANLEFCTRGLNENFQPSQKKG